MLDLSVSLIITYLETIKKVKDLGLLYRSHFSSKFQGKHSINGIQEGSDSARLNLNFIG